MYFSFSVFNSLQYFFLHIVRRGFAVTAIGLLGASKQTASCLYFVYILVVVSQYSAFILPSYVLALDLEGVHDVKLHHPSSYVATSNQ